MKRLFARSAVMAAMAAMLLTAPALADSARVLRVKVPFSFTANGSKCPAGEYFFKSERGVIDLRNASGNIHLFMPVISSLARSSEMDDHLLAFDKIGEERALSEVWLPGVQGALVSAAKGKHEHEVVRLVHRPKK